MTDFHIDDPAYHDWLDMLEEKRRVEIMRSCTTCAYSLKEDVLRLGSDLYCYNRQCSHVGGNWTLCVHARDFEHGLCGSEGKFYKQREEEHES
jgi:hypothetical protein